MNIDFVPDVVSSWHEFFFNGGHWAGVLGWHLALFLVFIIGILIGHHFSKK